jgi:hypothetical protein
MGFSMALAAKLYIGQSRRGPDGKEYGIMTTTFCEYSLKTTLNVNDIELIFRDKIRKPANAFLKMARLRWEFVSPQAEARKFSLLGPANELSFALGARFTSGRKSTEGILRETIRTSVGGIILLGVRDEGTDRLVRIGHIDNTGAKSCVRNFTNALAAADKSVRVTEKSRNLAD